MPYKRNPMKAERMNALARWLISTAENGYWTTDAESERKRQAAAGIQTISFDAATARKFVEKADEVGWAAVLKANPEYGPRLKKALSKP